MQAMGEEGAASGGLTGWPLSAYRKRQLRIEFTGSGSEYFRIWIVNLLLTIVTAGLYWPFAKARRIRYFYANTVVDGHALAFHGDPWKMFRGHLLLTVLAVAYSVAGHLSPIGGIVAFLLVAALWPALWRAGLQFRMGNTSWRGLRFGFDGSLGGAYLPFLPGLLLVAMGPALVLLVPKLAGYGSDRAKLSLLFALPVLLGLLVLALMPLVLTLVKRYQHNGYRFASQRASVVLPMKSVYWLGLKCIGVSIVTGLALTVPLLIASFLSSMLAGGSPFLGGLVFFIVGGLGYAAYLAIVGAYGTARFQNLLWNGTSTDDLDVTSQLQLRPLVVLTFCNWVFTALTLGLYRPFAAVHTARLRLESVSLTMDGDPETWVAGQDQSQQSAAGEFAGDFFGIDMGL